MNWINITKAGQLEEIKELSASKPQVIFKHSTRCSISSVAKSRLERATTPPNIDFYYLDLISLKIFQQKLQQIFLYIMNRLKYYLLKIENVCTTKATQALIWMILKNKHLLKKIILKTIVSDN